MELGNSQNFRDLQNECIEKFHVNKPEKLLFPSARSYKWLSLLISTGRSNKIISSKNNH